MQISFHAPTAMDESSFPTNSRVLKCHFSFRAVLCFQFKLPFFPGNYPYAERCTFLNTVFFLSFQSKPLHTLFLPNVLLVSWKGYHLAKHHIKLSCLQINAKITKDIPRKLKQPTRARTHISKEKRYVSSSLLDEKKNPLPPSFFLLPYHKRSDRSLHGSVT